MKSKYDYKLEAEQLCFKNSMKSTKTKKVSKKQNKNSACNQTLKTPDMKAHQTSPYPSMFIQ